VGGANPILAAGGQPYYLHWDGEDWTIVPSPPVPTYSGVFDVSAVSANDIWAVGSQQIQDTSIVDTLIEHWDGDAWSVVPSPSVPGANFTLLGDVAAVASDDVWAVGRWGTPPTFVEHSAILHWDGASWSVVSHPGIGTLWGVVGISADDVWAGGDGGKLHWDGEEWSLFPSVGPSIIQDFAAISSGDVWAVGSRTNAAGPRTLAEHWDGISWKRVKLPTTLSGDPTSPLGDAASLLGVAAASSTDIWAVGYYGTVLNPNTLSLHWNGKRWKIVPSPNP
jgi:hypothetical protein